MLANMHNGEGLIRHYSNSKSSDTLSPVIIPTSNKAVGVFNPAVTLMMYVPRGFRFLQEKNAICL